MGLGGERVGLGQGMEVVGRWGIAVRVRAAKAWVAWRGNVCREGCGGAGLRRYGH